MASEGARRRREKTMLTFGVWLAIIFSFIAVMASGSQSEKIKILQADIVMLKKELDRERKLRAVGK